MDATCKTCPFWGPYATCDSSGTPVSPRTGPCRRLPPTPMMTQSGGDHPELTHENPEVADFWWCGEHPLRQRDRLAAMAMAMASYVGRSGVTMQDGPTAARFAYEIADAMLAARAKETP